MIRPLRRLHRAIFVVLAFALALLFILGLVARQEIPAVDTLPLPREVTR